MSRSIQLAFSLAIVIAFGVSCSDDGSPGVIFPVSQDIALGAQVNQQIRTDTTGQFPILDEATYPAAYGHIRRIMDKILESPDIRYGDRFAYDSIKIINADVLNAFATPGGYIYVYTGLIKYLDSEDQLAGVLGHEIAHAERRHSSRQLQNQYGIAILSAIILGNDPDRLAEITTAIAGGLASLSFSRKFETESDDYSVRYLSSSEYACNGAAGFFQKIKDQGQCTGSMTWLSTHPDPCDRIEEINQKATDVGCSTTELNPSTYQDFKNSLP